MFVFIVETLLCLIITEMLKFYGIFAFILKCVIVIIIPNIMNVLLFHKTKEFCALKEKFLIPLLNSKMYNKGDNI
jgi:hypothetical protein